MAISSRGEMGVGGGSRGGSGGAPQFTDYAKRRVTDELTKAEKAAEHKWRMKNDLDYKNQVAREKAAKGTQAGHKVTDSNNHTKPVK
jgi:hypothetical protein